MNLLISKVLGKSAQIILILMYLNFLILKNKINQSLQFINDLSLIYLNRGLIFVLIF